MSEIAIRAENLGKLYRIGGPQARYKTIRESLVEAVQAPVRGMGKLLRGAKRAGHANGDATIWALKDVSFEVKQGEVVGIIGRNGAGKSTLLKILSRITKPTEGYAEIHGWVGSLLEVGTGFHPELTGRENIFLNGAILGMKRREIDRKFDEIVAFAEIEKFIDTPVKHYSSGMHVRLAFAVAAHLQPEILVIDEVLAVGDMEFQKKCLGKMGDVARAGRTVLFVSHNMIAVQNLCQFCILLNSGKVEMYGGTASVVRKYQSSIEKQSVGLAHRVDRSGTGEMKCVNVSLLDTLMNPVNFLLPEQPGYIQLEFEADAELHGVMVGIGIDTIEGIRILTLYSEFTDQAFTIRPGQGRFLCKLPGLNLRPDTYLLSTFFGNQYGAFDDVPYATAVEIGQSDFYHTGRLPDRSQGPLLLPHSWSLVQRSRDCHVVADTLEPMLP